MVTGGGCEGAVAVSPSVRRLLGRCLARLPGFYSAWWPLKADPLVGGQAEPRAAPLLSLLRTSGCDAVTVPAAPVRSLQEPGEPAGRGVGEGGLGPARGLDWAALPSPSPQRGRDARPGWARAAPDAGHRGLFLCRRRRPGSQTEYTHWPLTPVRPTATHTSVTPPTPRMLTHHVGLKIRAFCSPGGRNRFVEFICPLTLCEGHSGRSESVDSGAGPLASLPWPPAS